MQHTRAQGSLLRCTNSLRQQIDSHEPLRCDARLRERLQPPAGPTAGVEQDALAIHPRRGELEQLQAHFLADGAVAGVLGAPGTLLAGVVKVPTKDVRGPLPLPQSIHPIFTSR